jgi:hypothetical protein
VGWKNYVQVNIITCLDLKVSENAFLYLYGSIRVRVEIQLLKR